LHVKFNVDVKVFNDPQRLFPLMHKIVTSYAGWETLLAPRILLGLWHPFFLKAAMTHVPYCRRSYIGSSPGNARKYFWEECEVFSMQFAALATLDGWRCVHVRCRVCVIADLLGGWQIPA